MDAHPWDRLAPLFAGSPDGESVPPALADSVLLAWPSVLECLLGHFDSLQGRRVLDFGCGTGLFARKLARLGAEVLGVDPSPAMIARAQQGSVPGLEFRRGGMEVLAQDETFDAITALMVFPFIENPKPTLISMRALLPPDGVVVLTTFHPGFVRRLLRAGCLFRDFDSDATPRRGMLDLTGSDPVEIHVRYADEYANLFDEHGFRAVFEARPPFTPSFRARNPEPYPTDVPEFLVMGFRKLREGVA